MRKSTLMPFAIVAGIAALAVLAFNMGPPAAAFTPLNMDPSYLQVGALAAAALFGNVAPTVPTDFASLAKVIQEQGETWEEFKSENERQLAEIKKGINDPLREEKLQKLSARIDELQEQKDRIEKLLNRPALGGSDPKVADIEAETKSFNNYRKSFANSGQQVAQVSVEDYVAYKSAYWNMVRKGNPNLLAPEEQKALVAGSDSDGGYLMPTPTVGRVVQRVFELSPIRAIAGAITISADALEGLYDNDEASDGWVGETGARTETNTPQVGKYRIETMEQYAAPKATQKLLDDAAVDVEAWLVGKVANRFARREAVAFISGDGVAKPRGFTTYTTVETADGTRTWGQLEDVKTGANGDFAATNPADVLFDLIQAFKTAHLQNANWVTLRTVIAKIRKFKEATTNAYMWQPGLQRGQPAELLGYPIVIAQDMPALATGSLSLALGDFREGYQIVDRVGIRTLRDPFTNKPYVIFYSTRRVGGGVLNFDAIKFIKFSA
jgi:HK97 family phage major capsid protein